VTASSKPPKLPRTLIGLEPVVAAAPTRAPTLPKPDGKRPVRPTQSWGIPAVKGTSGGWASDPSLLGLFPSDGAAMAVSRPTWVARALPLHLFQGPASGTARVRPTVLPDEEGQLPTVGTIIDKYRLEELLGIGGFAAVYRATHLLMKSSVAIKLLRPNLLKRNPSLGTLLCREAELARLVDHSNVVKVFDVTRTATTTFLVMEYVDGPSLSEVIRRRKLTPMETIELALDVIAGLKAGLQGDLIHRDIKPANIICAKHGRAKIVDLGLAICFADLQSGDTSLTRVGTREYSSPEQAQSPHAVDFRSDVFSLGATLYHASLGTPPFPTLTDRDGVPRKMLNRSFRRPQDVDPTVPPGLARLLCWMLEPEPRDRPSSYTELERQFIQLRASLDGPFTNKGEADG
jgi:serine/threonine protein kinase